MESSLRLVAITNCPAGIAHTSMVAEALEQKAHSLGHTIKVETQGSSGVENHLTHVEIAAADSGVKLGKQDVQQGSMMGHLMAGVSSALPFVIGGGRRRYSRQSGALASGAGRTGNGAAHPAIKPAPGASDDAGQTVYRK